MAKLVTLDDLTGAVNPADRIPRHAEYLGPLGCTYPFSLGDVHFTPQYMRVKSMIRAAVSLIAPSGCTKFLTSAHT
ncbi:hypothetical protein E2553_26960 [Paraburkholderia dipogonis]|uniref:Uncharacterized protein n=1 Tax=Paraburkholderia dipogonis TaxID=1211383 RepID=A0A4Y8MSD6_9BURK|nr:hypothetical protein E2553_26960 [Paraburkholderia dipogonis]